MKAFDDGMLSCLDYLLAATDYQDFVNLMLEFRETSEWEGDAADLQGLLAPSQTEPQPATSQGEGEESKQE